LAAIVGPPRYARVLLPTITVELRDGFAFVEQTGELTMAVADELLERLEGLLASAGHRRVLFDNRRTEAPSREVRDYIHGEVTTPGRFERLAFVFDSDMLVTSVRLDALARGIPLRAFATLEEAEAWLRR
jgi:hypothetical protein